jgi:ATP-binding cassette subfamily B (MDR/TAP) protein 1
MDYVMLTDCGEPSCYQEVMLAAEKVKWEKAMQSEMNSLHKNHTWELVQLPEGKKALPCKWVYKEKITPSDGRPKYKARLVAKGFKQQQGIDFDEIFSPVVKMTTLRCVLALVAREDMDLVQMDVKTTFLHGDLHEEVYMQQPEGYIEKGKENLVCRLKKSLYGLKQAPRQWYHKFHSFMLSQGYRRSDVDHCLYTKRATDGSLLILVLYVDDMLIVGNSSEEISVLKSKLHANFDMKDMGEASHILGMRIRRDRCKRLLYLS